MKDVQETLDRLVPEPARMPGWDDVMSGASARRRRRSRRIVALAASMLVVAVGTASAFGTVRNFFLHTGFIGLPPLGATPSSPESGELELFYWVWSPQLRRPPTGPWDGDVGRSRAWLYADGRLIWLRDATLPEGANRWSSGFLEQRLSPEGVKLLRSEVASHAVACRRDTGGCGIRIQVRDGDRLVPVRWARDLDHSALRRLETRLSDPAPWLPSSAWEDQRIRAYVPSRFVVCYMWPSPPRDPSRILPLLPEPVEDLLRSRDRIRVDWNPPQYCSDVTTEEARSLAKALDDAGFEREQPPQWLAYRFKVPFSMRQPALIYFEPYLPHGEWTCSACG
jgi:hypothetical protein